MTVHSGRNVSLRVSGGVVDDVLPGDPGAEGWILPAFVDAHVHCTQTGLMLDGLDLHGCRSLGEMLDAVAAYARSRPGAVVLGTGWDETRWPERRPPTAAELDRATGGAVVYIPRVDVHSAVVSSALLDACGLAGEGWVDLDAHHDVRLRAYASLTGSQIETAQRRTMAHAASLGIGTLHEMSGPVVAGERDLASVLRVAADVGLVVDPWWAAIGDVETPLRHGAGAGGDLFCDGSFGSRTAALKEPYADAPGCFGTLHHTSDAVAAHVVAAVEAGLGTGFHVIGDAAIELVLDGYERAAAEVPLTTALHRLEHVEMASPESVARMARLGLVASVQPAFDAAWGGPDGMYADRLGGDRAAGLNPYAAFVRAGVPLLFGSDSPVTPLDGWGEVRAAVRHRTEGFGVPYDVAFAAATGYARLEPGHWATFAVWDGDGRDLDSPPACLRTVVRGRKVHAA